MIRPNRKRSEAMKKIIITFFCLVCISLNGCAIFKVYKPTIQQGNDLTQGMVNQLHPGMTKSQVLHVLGTPVLNNILDEDHWAYVYTLQKNGKNIEERRLDLYFHNDRLKRISGVGYQLPF